MGELHLDIIMDRLKREFKVEVNQGAPQVALQRSHYWYNPAPRKPTRNKLVAVVNLPIFRSLFLLMMKVNPGYNL